ncbi:cell wall-binding repeat-containing protein [Rossellomorea vietnamensis]|uniref:cell wall-binding repeat-containing protein n=1 Tax=Rossellomorea vietnamensis TaxID=218284 RepID=UPI003CF1DAEE
MAIRFLLTDKQSLPTATKKALEGIEQTSIIGGSAVISDSVVSELNNTVRISGSSRYEAAVNIIKELNMHADRVYVATGTSFADALTGSVLAAKNNAPLFLVKQNEVPAVVNTFITQKQITDFTILGGKGAVGDMLREGRRDWSFVPLLIRYIIISMIREGLLLCS